MQAQLQLDRLSGFIATARSPITADSSGKKAPAEKKAAKTGISPKKQQKAPAAAKGSVEKPGKKRPAAEPSATKPKKKKIKADA